tara:strand:+ start:647 stop:2707 length:2061 start_codon:yes stop_codon:yes gene_type:complete
MTFLAPSNLWFLLGISIPIIIHILSRLRTNTIEFSSVRYIKELEASSIRKLKIKELILLIIRIIIIICLVLMFSQPYTKGFMPGWLSAEMESKVIILLDNSASMSAKYNGKSFLERSKNEAMALLSIFNDKTEVVIAKTCPPRIVYDGIPDDSEFRKSIKSVEASNSYDNIWQTINDLITEKVTKKPINEFIIFSDLMHKPDSSFLHDMNTLKDWRFYFIQPNEVINNIGIIDANSIDRIKTLNKLVKLTTQVENAGINKSSNSAIELLFNKQRVGQVITEFEPGVQKGFLFQAYPTEVGIIQSEIVLPIDDYELDNIWYDTMPIMRKINCQIIVSDTNDIDLLQMVFNAIDPEKNFLITETVVTQDLKRMFFGNIDVAIVHNPIKISHDAIKDLDKFLNEGGGLIWFQGDADLMDPSYGLLTQIGFPLPIDIINSGQGFFSTHILDDKSDLLNDIQVRNLQKELPKVSRYIKTEPNTNHTIHWELNNHDPFIIEFSRGIGKVFYFSNLFNLGWSDLPIRAIALPLIQRLILLTGTDAINTTPVLIDEPKWISIEESKLMNNWKILSPSGSIEMVIPEYDKEGINISNTSELGIYQVFNNDEQFTAFPTRLNYKEYIQDRIGQEDIEFLIPKERTKWLSFQNEFLSVFSETRQGKSLWKTFLLLAFILLLIESIIGKPKMKNMKVG